MKKDRSKMKGIKFALTSGSINVSETTKTETSILNSNTFIWKGGWVSDNFNSYYLDENMVKHYYL